MGGRDRGCARSITRELVTVTLNESPTSRWRLYRRKLPDAHDLSGEIAVGLRVALDSDRIVPAVDESVTAPFHLFFPTKIGSGLPFLLHGYFEVNAARTGFYDGSAAQNAAILNILAALVAEAVADTAAHDTSAVASLPDLLGRCVTPDDPHATAFHSQALGLLDHIAWVPLETGHAVPALATPTELFVDDQPNLIDRIAGAFPPSTSLLERIAECLLERSAPTVTTSWCDDVPMRHRICGSRLPHFAGQDRRGHGRAARKTRDSAGSSIFSRRSR